MVSATELKAALKQRGLRMTPQRQLILDAVASMRGHLSAEQVYQHVVRVFPDVNISTVYRTLEVLEELGVVRHTHFHSGVAQYERTDTVPHQHIVCSRCGADTEVEVEVLQPLAEELTRRYGFEADLVHSAIVGICRGCQAAEE
ncbi:MAG TPA: Fur family transcriptional regulator [Chloroflexota bacterium]